jgi:hypothetical protein
MTRQLFIELSAIQFVMCGEYAIIHGRLPSAPVPVPAAHGVTCAQPDNP